MNTMVSISVPILFWGLLVVMTGLIAGRIAGSLLWRHERMRVKRLQLQNDLLKGQRCILMTRRSDLEEAYVKGRRRW